MNAPLNIIMYSLKMYTCTPSYMDNYKHTHVQMYACKIFMLKIEMQTYVKQVARISIFVQLLSTIETI